MIDLVELARLGEPDDWSLLKRKIRFGTVALQDIVWVWQQADTEARTEETAEIISLCWQIQGMRPTETAVPMAGAIVSDSVGELCSGQPVPGGIPHRYG